MQLLSRRVAMARVRALWKTWMAPGLMFVLPNPYRYLLWIPYAILLPLGIVYANRTQQRIRKEESKCFFDPEKLRTEKT